MNINKTLSRQQEYTMDQKADKPTPSFATQTLTGDPERSVLKSMIDFGRQMLDAHQQQQSFSPHTREDPVIGSPRGDVEINKVPCVMGEKTVAHPGHSLARQALSGPGSPLFFSEPVSSLDRDQAMRSCVVEHKDKYYFEDGSSIEWHANGMARTTTPVAHYSPEQLQSIALEASKPKVGFMQSLAARMGATLGVDGTKKPEATSPNGP